VTAGRGTELGRRVAVAAVGIPVVAAAAVAGGAAFAGLAALFAAVGAWEFYRMVARRGVVAVRGPGVAWAAAWPLLAWLAAGPGPAFALGVVTGLVLLVPGVLRVRPEGGPATAAAATLLGAAYPGVLLSFAVLLREMGPEPAHGIAAVGFPLVVTWVGDTAAYAVGRSAGRRPLAPRWSPKKTWEGAVGGVAASVLAGGAYGSAAAGLAGAPFDPAWSAALGGLVSLFGQMGDLFESAIKRDCGVKDSSGLLPGHGGVLDRVDSLLFAFPVTYVSLRLAWGA
jgi:phosphatidate cytidylyltransferase